MGDRYVQGFASCPEISPQSKFFADSYKSPSDETITWGPPCVTYTCKKNSYAHQRSWYSTCQSWVDHGNTQITQHALKIACELYRYVRALCSEVVSLWRKLFSSSFFFRCRQLSKGILYPLVVKAHDVLDLVHQKGCYSLVQLGLVLSLCMSTFMLSLYRELQNSV